MKTMHPLILTSAMAVAILTGTALCPNASAAEPGAQAEAAKPAAQGEMIAGGDGMKLFLRRDLPEGDVRAVLVIVHGLANHHGLYDEFVKPFGGHGIAVYRYDARGHGHSMGGHVSALHGTKYPGEASGYILCAGVGHFLMAEEKGHMIAPEIITWIEDRISGGKFVDAGI